MWLQVARDKRKSARDIAIDKYNAAAGKRKEEAMQRCGMAPKPAAASAIALFGGAGGAGDAQQSAGYDYDQSTGYEEYPQLQY